MAILGLPLRMAKLKKYKTVESFSDDVRQLTGAAMQGQLSAELIINVVDTLKNTITPEILAQGPELAKDMIPRALERAGQVNAQSSMADLEEALKQLIKTRQFNAKLIGIVERQERASKAQEILVRAGIREFPSYEQVQGIFRKGWQVFNRMDSVAKKELILKNLVRMIEAIYQLPHNYNLEPQDELPTTHDFLRQYNEVIKLISHPPSRIETLKQSFARAAKGICEEIGEVHGQLQQTMPQLAALANVTGGADTGVFTVPIQGQTMQMPASALSLTQGAGQTGFLSSDPMKALTQNVIEEISRIWNLSVEEMTVLRINLNMICQNKPQLRNCHRLVEILLKLITTDSTSSEVYTDVMKIIPASKNELQGLLDQ